ncbi:MAG: hypothetical protein ACYCYO_07520 [Bacilli bacterium]
MKTRSGGIDCYAEASSMSGCGRMVALPSGRDRMLCRGEFPKWQWLWQHGRIALQAGSSAAPGRVP